MSEREEFLREWFLFLRKYENSTDPVVAYGVGLQRPLFAETSDRASREQQSSALRVVSSNED